MKKNNLNIFLAFLALFSIQTRANNSDVEKEQDRLEQAESEVIMDDPVQADDPSIQNFEDQSQDPINKNHDENKNDDQKNDENKNDDQEDQAIEHKEENLVQEGLDNTDAQSLVESVFFDENDNVIARENLLSKEDSMQIHMLNKLLSNDQKARIFFIWSAGYFGSFKQAFIGGSKEEQDKFFSKIEKLLTFSEEVKKEKNLLQSKLVFELVLDESTLKNALARIQEIEQKFPGSIRIEVMEKLLNRLQQKGFTKQKQNSESTLDDFSLKPIKFQAEHPGTSEILFTSLSPKARTLDEDDIDETMTTLPSEPKKEQSSSLFNQDDLSQRFDLSFVSGDNLTLLRSVFANALNGNPAVSSDVLRLVLLNDQTFDWNVYCDVDTFNASKNQNLEAAFQNQEVDKPFGVFFIENANDIIIGHNLTSSPEANLSFKKVIPQFLEKVRLSTQSGPDIFKTYHDQIKRINYAYDESKPETSVTARVDEYLDTIMKYATQASSKGSYRNLAETVIDVTGPGQIAGLSESIEKIFHPMKVSGEHISAQAWLEGKMTRWTKTAYAFNLDVKTFALLWVLDDFALIKKTNDYKFIKALLTRIKERWPQAVSNIAKIYHQFKKAGKNLAKNFIYELLKMSMPKNIVPNWIKFLTVLEKGNMSFKAIYEQFKAEADWAYQTIMNAKKDEISEKDALSSKDAKKIDPVPEVLLQMIGYGFINDLKEEYEKQEKNKKEEQDLELIKQEILKDLEPEELKKWAIIIQNIKKDKSFPITYLSDLSRFVNLVPLLGDEETDFEEIVDRSNLYTSILKLLKKAKKQEYNLDSIGKYDWLDPDVFQEMVRKSSESIIECPDEIDPSNLNFDQKIACFIKKEGGISSEKQEVIFEKFWSFLKSVLLNLISNK